MESRIEELKKILCEKAATKQVVYHATLDTFRELKLILRNIEKVLAPCVAESAPSVEVKFSDKGDFEAHLKFGGDTIVAMMHTNVFDFDDNHVLAKSRYVKEDPMREFCGMIQVFNFLSDSLKYNRESDYGYLIARIFVNKEKHFFIDGKRPLSFQFKDFGKNILDHDVLQQVVEEVMLFCLNFDLMAPPVDTINVISVEQKNLLSYSSGIPTSKLLGFYTRSEFGSEEA